jgi:hypothetical protein
MPGAINKPSYNIHSLTNIETALIYQSIFSCQTQYFLIEHPPKSISKNNIIFYPKSCVISELLW